MLNRNFEYWNGHNRKYARYVLDGYYDSKLKGELHNLCTTINMAADDGQVMYAIDEWLDQFEQYDEMSTEQVVRTAISFKEMIYDDKRAELFMLIPYELSGKNPRYAPKRLLSPVSYCWHRGMKADRILATRNIFING